MSRLRANLPQGLWGASRRSPKPSEALIGKRIGSVTVIGHGSCGYSKIRCDRGHETFQARAYLASALKSGKAVGCQECKRLEREERATG